MGKKSGVWSLYHPLPMDEFSNAPIYQIPVLGVRLAANRASQVHGAAGKMQVAGIFRNLCWSKDLRPASCSLMPGTQERELQRLPSFCRSGASRTKALLGLIRTRCFVVETGSWCWELVLCGRDGGVPGLHLLLSAGTNPVLHFHFPVAPAVAGSNLCTGLKKFRSSALCSTLKL